MPSSENHSQTGIVSEAASGCHCGTKLAGKQQTQIPIFAACLLSITTELQPHSTVGREMPTRSTQIQVTLGGSVIRSNPRAININHCPNQQQTWLHWPGEIESPVGFSLCFQAAAAFEHQQHL